MTIEINAGDTFSVSCPSGESPILTIGDKLPNEKEILVKIIKIQKDSVVLGPFKTGNIKFSLPCSSSTVQVEAIVKELNPQVAHQHFPSLNAEKVDYPLGFIIFCSILISLILGTFFYIKYKRRKQSFKIEKPKTLKDPRSNLEKHLVFCETKIKNPESKDLHETYKLLRDFLEKENNLNTRSLTTSEFLGTFRALSLKQSSNQNFLSQLEYILKTSDDVRFAKKTMSPEMWQDYISKTKKIFLSFPKKPEVPEIKNGNKP